MKNIFILSVCSLLLTSCEFSDKPATGLEDEIYVIADDADYEVFKPSLEKVFEKLIYTPQPEKIFTLTKVRVEDFEKYRTSKNLIIIAPFNSNSNTSKLVKTILDSAVALKAINNNEILIKRNDIWAKEQLVIFITAPDALDLKYKIENNKEELFSSFQKISDKRLQENLYDSKFEKKNLQGELLKKYGWVIYVQDQFQVVEEKTGESCVWLRRSSGSDLDKWIFVHWIENASPDYLIEDSIKALRNRITHSHCQKFTDNAHVRVAKDFYTTSEVNFKGRYAILTQGLWELSNNSMQGPFINYTFFDDKSGRVYMLDASVYAPKHYKRNLIQQLDVILQSFMTANELSPDRKEELLEAAQN